MLFSFRSQSRRPVRPKRRAAHMRQLSAIGHIAKVFFGSCACWDYALGTLSNILHLFLATFENSALGSPRPKAGLSGLSNEEAAAMPMTLTVASRNLFHDRL